MYYRGSAAAVIVYDITKLVSFQLVLPNRTMLKTCITCISSEVSENISTMSEVIVLMCLFAGLFPNIKEMGEGTQRTWARGHSRGYSWK